MPKVLHNALLEEVELRTAASLEFVRNILCKAIVNKFSQCLTASELATASRQNSFSIQPEICRTLGQTDASLRQRRAALQVLIKKIIEYLSGNSSFIKHTFVLGQPGTGKTTLTLNALSYAICRGLTCVTTSLAGKKSAELGGIHSHPLLPLPVDQKLPVNKLEEVTVRKLYQQPLRLALMRRLDILVVEELGLFNIQQWAVLDKVLQYVNENDVPMGGV